MNKLFFSAIAAAMLCGCAKTVETTVSIIPQPVQVIQKEGTFPVGEVTKKINSKLAEEEYILKARKGRVTIEGGSDAGTFWGEQTLKQLLAQGGGMIPNIFIKDKPLFHYRGAMLDCGRHFFSIEDVKTFIDIMAMHKLNTFHWHLTEDQGWRIEIKKYPKLTEIGSMRAETLVGHHRDENRTFDGTPYGGFYTQDECREIVKYAADRHITVIPEIEMPGHSVAALTSYPELGCTGGPYEVRKIWGISEEVYCLGKDNTIQFLKDVLDEVCDIFPSKYIHIGGDEAPRKYWKDCPFCQKRIADQGLANEDELQSWLVREIESYLAEKGRRIIGWDEILKGGVTKSATVMSWRGTDGGKKAAAMGNDVIMAPKTYYYLDYYQSEGGMENGEPLSIGGHLNLEQCYSFDPFEDLDEESRSHILGIQANMWTEYVGSISGVQFHILPRLCALCEICWNPSGKTSYETFKDRISTALLPLYNGEHWNYADFAFRNPEIK